MKRLNKLLAGLLLALAAPTVLAGCSVLPDKVPTSWEDSKTKAFFEQRQITEEHIYLVIEASYAGKATVDCEIDGNNQSVLMTISYDSMGYSCKDGVYTDLVAQKTLTEEKEIQKAKAFIKSFVETIRIPSSADQVREFYVKQNTDEDDDTYTEHIRMTDGTMMEYTFDAKGELTDIIAKPAGSSSSKHYPVKTIRRQR